MTVATLTARMSHRELVEWRTWYSLEPRGEDRADWHAGWGTYIAAAIAAGRKGRRLRWQDFVPFRRKVKMPETAEVSPAAVLAALGGNARIEE